MAILFYDDISLDRQEVQNVSLQHFTTSGIAALSGAAEEYQGRIAYDTDLASLVYYNGSNWVYLDGTGNIDSITGTGGIDAGGSAQVGDITISVDYTSAANIIASVPTTSSSVTTSSRIFVSVGDAVESHSLSTIKGIIHAGVASISPGSSSYVANTISSPDGSGNVTIGSTLGTTSSAGYYFNGAGDWVAAPDNANTLYTFGVPSTGIIRLTAVGGGDTDVTIQGTANEVDVTTNTGSNQFTLGLPANVTVPGTLKVVGVATFANNTNLGGDLSIAGDISVTGQASFETFPVIPATTPTDPTSAASKKYVDDVVSGGLVFKGGYDADTDANNLEDPLNGGIGTGILVGYTYVVTDATSGGNGTGGTTWSPALSEGDLIICNTDTPTQTSEWSAVQRNITQATSSVAGTAMFPEGNGFATPTGSGAISLFDHSALAPAATYGSSTTIPRFTTNTFGVIAAAENTTIQITTGQVDNFETTVDGQIDTNSNIYTIVGDGNDLEFDFTNTTGSELTTVQVYQTLPATETGNTVYPKVTRSAGAIQVSFKVAPEATDAFKVLVIGNTA